MTDYPAPERKVTCPVCGKQVCVLTTKEGRFIRVHKNPEAEVCGPWCEGSDRKLTEEVHIEE